MEDKKQSAEFYSVIYKVGLHNGRRPITLLVTDRKETIMYYINDCPSYYRQKAFKDMDSAMEFVNDFASQEEMKKLGIDNGMIKMNYVYQRDI